MMTHSMVLTNVVIKTSKIFKQRCGIWQDGAIAKEMTLTALVHRPPRVAVLGNVVNRKLHIRDYTASRSVHPWYFRQ